MLTGKKLFLGAVAVTAVRASSGDSVSCIAGAHFSASCRPSTPEILTGDELNGQNEYVHLLQHGMLISRAEAALRTTQPVSTSTEATTPNWINIGEQLAALRATQPVSTLTVSQKKGAKTTTVKPSVASGKVTTTLGGLDLDDPLGVGLNAEGDLSAFVAGTISNTATWFLCIAIFSVLRVRYPRMYSNNVLKGTAPGPKPDLTAHFSWIQASLSYTIEEAIVSIGLDHAMMLEFLHLCMRILAIIGLPMCFIMGPLHYFFGGHAAGDDRLSYFSFGNVESGSWLYWIHAFIVWGVVFTVQTSVYAAQRQFLHLRFAWMRQMGDLRATTVLVEGIPQEHQSDEMLKTFFDMIFPGGKVESAYVAKDTKGLVNMVAELELAKKSFVEAEAADKKDPSNPLMMKETIMGAKVRAVGHWTREIHELEPKIEALRKQVKEAAGKVGWVGGNTSSGFVTFNNRCDAELALRLDGVSPDDEEFVISTPPAPDDILWADLTQDDNAEEGRTVTGYLLVAGLYFAYMPAVLGMTNIAQGINLGPLQPMWASLAPTFGLTVMVAFLPTFLRMIFESFFTLKAAAWAQQKIQSFYFWFQVVFVLMATAVGQDVTGFTHALFTEPLTVFSKLALTMPYATHFYMNYLVMQSATHAMNMLRHTQLMKYLGFRALYADEQAADMAEPEDQDYYGIGSRSARWTINMLIGIVFGTLCPPMILVCFVLFAEQRLIYGYLLPFAETQKADLGGAFWCTKLRHLFYGNMIYVILMTSVLFLRAASPGPAIIAFPSLFYVIWSYVRFQSAFNWEKLPFQELMRPEDVEVSSRLKKRVIAGKYMQPELHPEALK